MGAAVLVEYRRFGGQGGQVSVSQRHNLSVAMEDAASESCDVMWVVKIIVVPRHDYVTGSSTIREVAFRSDGHLVLRTQDSGCEHSTVGGPKTHIPIIHDDGLNRGERVVLQADLMQRELDKLWTASVQDHESHQWWPWRVAHGASAMYEDGPCCCRTQAALHTGDAKLTV